MLHVRKRKNEKERERERERERKKSTCMEKQGLLTIDTSEKRRVSVIVCLRLYVRASVSVCVCVRERESVKMIIKTKEIFFQDFFSFPKCFFMLACFG